MGSQRVGHDLATEQQQQQALMKEETEPWGAVTHKLYWVILGHLETFQIIWQRPPLEGGWARELQDRAEVGSRERAYISRQCCLKQGQGGGAPKSTVMWDLS